MIVGLPVPEPSTWAMMFLGFLGLGYAGYRKGKSAQTTFAHGLTVVLDEPRKDRLRAVFFLLSRPETRA